MKKLYTLIAVAIVAMLAVGCGSSSSGTDTMKTGFAVMTSVEKSIDAGKEAGTAQTDSTVVGVLVDKDGKIADIAIDSVQTKIQFDSKGKLVSDVTTMVPTKRELGDDYGMKKASKVGKEWYEQIDALAEYAKGKTVDELKAITLNDKGAPADTELSSSVTISIGGYLKAIEKAVTSAEDLGAMSGDKLGLGISTNIAKSKDATKDEAGLGQAYSTYTLATFDADGKITSAIIDGSQGNVNFDTKGKITTDLGAEIKTKNELGADYGMKSNSKIDKEWNEQAKAYADYAKGKTLDELKNVKVDEKGAPVDTELSSSVTISIKAMNECLEKAYKAAQ